MVPLKKKAMSVDTPDYNVFAANCPSRDTFDHVFGKWGMLILARLKKGPARFGEISRAVEGISERMLSKSLKVLVEEGLVIRKDFAEKPPRVEYSLSESGDRIGDAVLEVISRLYESMQNRDHETV